MFRGDASGLNAIDYKQLIGQEEVENGIQSRTPRPSDGGTFHQEYHLKIVSNHMFAEQHTRKPAIRMYILTDCSGVRQIDFR